MTRHLLDEVKQFKLYRLTMYQEDTLCCSTTNIFQDLGFEVIQEVSCHFPGLDLISLEDTILFKEVMVSGKGPMARAYRIRENLQIETLGYTYDLTLQMLKRFSTEILKSAYELNKYQELFNIRLRDVTFPEVYYNVSLHV